MRRPRAIPAVTVLVVALAVAAGAGLRLMHPGDIEYKADERFTFEAVQRVLHGGAWPELGMPMSVGPPNAGMSVWVFVVLGRVAGVTTPPDLARAVQMLNVAAILGLVTFAATSVPRDRAEPWLWAAALWAVNPMAIMLERKIWAQSVLPAFAVGAIAAWPHRGRWAGAFVLTLVLGVAGQIHMSAACFGAGLLIWAALDDWRAVRWSGVAAGAAVAAVPAAPWIATVATTGTALHRWRLPFGSFYKYWLLRAGGFGANQTLGSADFARFLGWPIAAGRPTWGVFALHAAVGMLGALLAALALRELVRRRRVSIRALLVGSTAAGRIVRASFWGCGGLLTIATMTGAGLYAHYLEMLAPVMALWVALVAALADGGAIGRRGRTLLCALCICDALIAIALLAYVHRVGDIQGDFGRTWAAQQRAAGSPGK